MAQRGTKIFKFDNVATGSVRFTWSIEKISDVQYNLYYEWVMHEAPPNLATAQWALGDAALYCLDGIMTANLYNSPDWTKYPTPSYIVQPMKFPESGVSLNTPINFILSTYYTTTTGDRQTVSINAKDTLDFTPNTAGTYITFDGNYMDEPMKIGTYAIDTNYTNNITYQFGTVSGTIATGRNTPIYEWQPDTTLINGLSATAKEGSFIVKVATYNGGTLVGNYQASFPIFTNYNTQGPQFNPTIIDTNAATKALTGNENTIVAVKSIVKVNSGVYALGKGTVTECSIITENEYISAQSTTLQYPSPLVTFNASDTREYYTERTYTPVKYIEYYEPRIIANTTMSAAGVITSEITGRWFNDSFGVAANTITASFRYQQSGDSTWSNWTNFNLTIDEEMINGTVTINGLNYRQRYDIEVRVIDKLSTITIETSSMGTPVFDWSKTDFNFNVPVNFAAGAVGASSAIVYTCNTPSNTAAKILVGNEDITVREGLSIYVTFENINLVDNVTFRIGVTTYPATSLNGSLIKAWAANSLVEFIYYESKFVLVTRGDTQDAPTPSEDKEVVIRESILTVGDSFNCGWLGDYDRIRFYARFGDRYVTSEVDVSYPRLYTTIRTGIYVPTSDLLTTSSTTSVQGFSMFVTINLPSTTITLNKITQHRATYTASDEITNVNYHIYRIVGIKQ